MEMKRIRKIRHKDKPTPANWKSFRQGNRREIFPQKN